MFPSVSSFVDKCSGRGCRCDGHRGMPPCPQGRWDRKLSSRLQLLPFLLSVARRALGSERSWWTRQAGDPGGAVVHFPTPAEPALSLEARWRHGRPAGFSEFVVCTAPEGLASREVPEESVWVSPDSRRRSPAFSVPFVSTSRLDSFGENSLILRLKMCKKPRFRFQMTLCTCCAKVNAVCCMSAAHTPSDRSSSDSCGPRGGVQPEVAGLSENWCGLGALCPRSEF